MKHKVILYMGAGMRVWRDRKLVSSVVIVIVGVLAFTTILDTLVNWAGMRTVNQQCTVYLQDWTNQALATATTAAVVNAGLSVIEDSQFQLEPGGIGMSVALGDAVRPVNGIVSKLVSVALASAVALQIQKTLIGIGAAIALKWLLVLSLLFLLLAIWLDWPLFGRLAWGFFVLALVARLLIPGAVFLTGEIGDQLTTGTYSQTQAQFEQLGSETTKTKEVVTNLASADGGSFNPIQRFRDFKEQMSSLLSNLAETTGSIGKAAVDLAAIFLVQTIVMPLLILWALIKLPGYLLDTAGTAGAGQWFLGLLRGSNGKEERDLIAEDEAQAA